MPLAHPDRPTTDPNAPHAVPFVSVIIPIYNGEADLADLVECLWSQTYPADRVEYLLVDNNSGDRTYECLQSYEVKSSARNILFRALQEHQIQSSYAARNTGIKSSQGSILVFTDADCRPCPNWLNDLIPPFTDETIGIVAGEVTGLPSHNWLETYADRQETLSQKHTLNHAFLPYGQTANLAVRREAFQQVGLFRPYLTTGGDADICWRIQQHTGWAIAFAESAVVQHRHRASLAELRSQWRRYGRSNRYLHDLHGIPLTPPLSLRETTKRLVRWGLKDIPKSLVTGDRHLSTLLSTPLSLMCIHARSHGQAQATLNAQARKIDHWEPMASADASH
jgi:cellulose synthase/poly-beta-1,6-N-acetylglucosamine synthase-like glycosyltransferase